MGEIPLYPHRAMLRVPTMVAVLDGPFDLARSLATLEAMQGHPLRIQVQSLVWDVRRRSGFPNSEEVRRLVERFHDWKRVAILTHPDVQYVQYGMARMTSLLADNVFAARTNEEAIHWTLGLDEPV